MTSSAPKTLWAKGRKSNDGDPPTVLEHCNDVYETARALWDVLEEPIAKAVSMSTDALRSRIRQLFLVSAVLHDVMKANSAFQDMVHGRLQHRGQRQPVRHEVLAAVLLHDEQIWGKWLAKGLDEQARWAVIWAVGGHHLQMRGPRVGDSANPLFRINDAPSKIEAYLGHEQVRNIFKLVCTELDINPSELPASPHRYTFDVLDESDDGLERTIERFVQRSRSAWRRWRHDDEFKRDLALLKALLIAADVAGSALPVEFATSQERLAWIIERLNRTLSESELNDLSGTNLNGRKPHGFQMQVAGSEHLVTIVTAGCGNGKTTAAYMWAKHWAKHRKLFFTYPTTGTASAGFRDYLLLQPDVHRSLIHGRAEVDLRVMLESDDVPPMERAQRLESLNAWGQQAVACTVDTILGLIQNQRRPLFALPAILRGAFVFDEVHSYDKRMFSALLRFLKTFPGLPALIMSASLPPARLEALKLVAGNRMNSEPIRGEQTLEQIKRYRLHERSEPDCWAETKKLLGANNGRNAKKILWVCNTVNDAVSIFREANKRFPKVTVLLYHSRYRYKDRVCLQDRVIEEFRYKDAKYEKRKHDRPAIAITTQVCEMSLDISADLLISACCPLPSLVQRLGRLHRYAEKDDPWPALVYEFSGRPYHEEDAPQHVEKAMQMVRELENEACSQAMLAQYVDQLQSSEELPKDSAWLDGGWQSEPFPLREGDNAITVVRAEDLPKPASDCRSTDVIPLTVPMLFRQNFTWTERAAGYPVAAGRHRIDYSWDDHTQCGEGATWRKAK